MNLLGNNLKSIRKSWGESQLDLSLFLGTEVSTISQWENGKRKPSNEILILIARHYHITVDDLLNGDLTQRPSMVDYFVKLKDNSVKFSKEISHLFPLFCATESEKENPSFLKALNIQKQIIKNGGNDVSDVDWDLMIENYLELFEKGGFPSAGANLLSLFFLIASTNIHLPYIDELISYLTNGYEKNTKKAAKDLISNVILNKDDLSHPCDDIFLETKDFNEIVLPIIEKLKAERKFYKLADYYFALRYVYGMVDNDLLLISNQQFGVELLFDLINVNNPFALRFFNFYKKYF